MHSLLGLGGQCADDADGLGRGPSAAVKRRNDDRRGDTDEDDERPDSEDATPNALFDLAGSNDPHVAQRVF